VTGPPCPVYTWPGEHSLFYDSPHGGRMLTGQWWYCPPPPLLAVPPLPGWWGVLLLLFHVAAAAAFVALAYAVLRANFGGYLADWFHPRLYTITRPGGGHE
jgi:hypothetical protein